MAAIHDQPSNMCGLKNKTKTNENAKNNAICFVVARFLDVLFSSHHFCTYENFYLSTIFAVRS